MAQRRQVGGMQEVFLQVAQNRSLVLNARSRPSRRLGGRVLHAFPPTIIVATVPAGKAGELVGVAGITASQHGYHQRQSAQGRRSSIAVSPLVPGTSTSMHDRRLRAMAARN